MAFEILSGIRDIETIAVGRGVYIKRYLERTYGKGRWRKRFQNQEGDPMSNFVICINSESNPASLILGKVYRTLSDAKAESHNMLRVVDEDRSEPDGYLYPASMFVPVELPEVAKRALTAAGA